MWNIKKNKIKSFIISRPSVRKVRGVFYNKIFPYLKYSFYLLIAILIAALIYLAIFKKSQLEKVKNNLLGYGYKVMHFNSGNIYGRINISGNKYTDYEDIANFARKYLVNYKDINNKAMIESLKNEIQTLPWVNEVVISVSLEDSLNINIEEYQPFAIWEDSSSGQDKKYIVSKDGQIIAVDNTEKFGNLVILAGKNAYKNVKSLFNILAIDPDISKNVYSATWVGGRRWNIRFESGLLIKLPGGNGDNDMRDAWDSLIKIYNMPGSLINLKTIDLRIAKKIYLEYDQSLTKELQSL
jgi:cell division septal protein FtsQ